MPAVYIALGIVLIVLAFSDIFQSVIVPRPVGRTLRPSAYISRWGWLSWRAVAHRIADNDKREDFLGTYAPFLLISQQIIWIAMLIFGYGLIFFGLREQLHPVADFGT